MSLPPIEIPLGAIRFNSDSQKLEYWIGDAWMQVKTFTPNLDGGARGLIMGGSYSSPGPGTHNQITFVTIPTAGDSTDFGDLTHTTRDGGSCASRTRGLYRFGTGPGDINDNVDFVTIASIGNAQDFGDLLNPKDNMMSKNGSSTRMLICGGRDYTPSATVTNVIEFITIATTGNSADFGDMTQARYAGTGCSSATRGVIAGGQTPTYVNTIDFVTIATTGNATDFGNLTFARVGATGCASATRGLFMGGRVAPNNKSEIDYITIASTGNALDFGDLQQQRIQASATASQTRGVHIGGNPGSSPNNFTNMQFVTIASLGNASDFGDTFAARSRRSASDCHGGLS